MAPEQLEGRATDAGRNIFAFGALLYEMATGKRAFVGESQASVISAILRDEPPPISTLQPLAPPALDGLGAEVVWRRIRATAGRVPTTCKPLRELAQGGESPRRLSLQRACRAGGSASRSRWRCSAHGGSCTAATIVCNRNHC